MAVFSALHILSQHKRCCFFVGRDRTPSPKHPAAKSATGPKTILGCTRLLIALLVLSSLSVGLPAEPLELLSNLEYGLDSPCAQGNYVYVNESGGIRPASSSGGLAIAGSDDSPSYGFLVAYVIGYDSLKMYSLRNPAHIFEMSSYPSSGMAVGASGRHVYAIGPDGLSIFCAPGITTRAKQWAAY